MVLRQLVARSTTKLGHTTLTVYRNQTFSHQGVQVKSIRKKIIVILSFFSVTIHDGGKVTFNKIITDENFNHDTWEQT